MTDVFQFYANSSSTPAPGKGTGETLISDAGTYKQLRSHQGWRRILSNSSETPFILNGVEWKTAHDAKVGTDTSVKDILYEKFTQHAEAKEILLLTGNAELWHAPVKSPKEHWTFLEEIREHIKRTMNSTLDMVEATKSKKVTQPSKKMTVQGGATMPLHVPVVQKRSSDTDDEDADADADADEEEKGGDTVTEIPMNVRATGVEEKVEAAESSKKSAIRFCTVCDNYLYLQVEGDTQTLQRICRNCGYKDTEEQGGLVSEMHIEQRAAEGYTLINEFTLKDKRLPHLHNTMRCINDKCPTSLPGKDSDIVYIKYDTENLRFIYMCYICQTTWRSRR